jgi:hypothetical protein
MRKMEQTEMGKVGSKLSAPPDSKGLGKFLQARPEWVWVKRKGVIKSYSIRRVYEI